MREYCIAGISRGHRGGTTTATWGVGAEIREHIYVHRANYTSLYKYTRKGRKTMLECERGSTILGREVHTQQVRSGRAEGSEAYGGPVAGGDRETIKMRYKRKLEQTVCTRTR